MRSRSTLNRLLDTTLAAALIGLAYICFDPYLWPLSEQVYFALRPFSHVHTNEYFLWYFPTALFQSRLARTIWTIIPPFLVLRTNIGGFSASIALAVLLGIFGQDFRVLHTSAVAIFIFNQLNRDESFRGTTVFWFLLGGLAALLGQSLSLLVVALVAVFSPKMTKRQFLPLVLIPLLVSFLIPPPPFPNFPLEARVVPDDGLEGVIRPLIGYTFPLVDIIDRVSIKGTYRITALVALVFSFFYYLWQRNRTNLVLLGLLSLVTLDLTLPEFIAQVLPIQTLRRVLPGAFNFNLTLELLAVLIISFISFSRRSLRRGWVPLAFGVTIVVTWPLGLDYQRLWLHFVKQSKSLLPTPSYALILRDQGHRIPLPRHAERVPPREYEIEASNPERLAGVVDRSPETRWWSTTQTGHEFIRIRLNQPTEVQGILADTGAFESDFSRGVHLVGSPNCREWFTIIPSQAWQGPLRLTNRQPPDYQEYFDAPRERALYYGPQSDVRLVFSAPQRLKCLELRQTGNHPRFDWSVTKITLYRPLSSPVRKGFLKERRESEQY